MKLFITGTDTGVGKTYVSIGLLNAFHRSGFSTLALKPVASGGVRKNNVLYNDDALQLQAASSIKLPYEQINPFAFEPAIAPSIAASRVRCELNLQAINLKLHVALNHPADLCLIEGFGGWYAPLNDEETMADFAIQQALPVIVIIAIRLGCLNHSLLTQHALANDNVRTIGWIANHISPKTADDDEMMTTLQRKLSIPCLGVMGYEKQPDLSIDIAYILSRIQ